METLTETFSGSLTFGAPIFDMQANGVLNVRNGLFVGVALAIASLQCRAGNVITVIVRLNDDRKSKLRHGTSQCASLPAGEQMAHLLFFRAEIILRVLVGLDLG